MKFIILTIVLNILCFQVQAVVHKEKKNPGKLEEKLLRINTWLDKVKNETRQIRSEISKLIVLVDSESQLIKERLNDDILKISDEFLLSFRKLKNEGVPIDQSEVIGALASIADVEAKIRHDIDKCIEMKSDKISRIDDYNTQLTARAEDKERRAKVIFQQIYKISDKDSPVLEHFQVMIDQVESAAEEIIKVLLVPHKEKVKFLSREAQDVKFCYTKESLDLIRQEVDRHLENFKFSYEVVNDSFV